MFGLEAPHLWRIAVFRSASGSPEPQGLCLAHPGPHHALPRRERGNKLAFDAEPDGPLAIRDGQITDAESSRRLSLRGRSAPLHVWSGEMVV
jgi:hypothetical protein